MLAVLCSIAPTMPGLAKNIDATLESGRVQYIAKLVWHYGFPVSFPVFVAVSRIWQAKDSLLETAL
jgi:NCS1 family nucleobase:cation symporter-1